MAEGLAASAHQLLVSLERPWREGLDDALHEMRLQMRAVRILGARLPADVSQTIAKTSRALRLAQGALQSPAGGEAALSAIVDPQARLSGALWLAVQVVNANAAKNRAARGRRTSAEQRATIANAKLDTVAPLLASCYESGMGAKRLLTVARAALLKQIETAERNRNEAKLARLKRVNSTLTIARSREWVARNGKVFLYTEIPNL